MTPEADFCGGRLRLSAFLRVVADGMPQRPTRFKRRLPPADSGHSFDTLCQRDTSLLDARDPSDHETAQEQLSDSTVLDVAHLPSLQPPALAAGYVRPADETNSEPRIDTGQCKDGQLSRLKQQNGEPLPNTRANRSLEKPRKTSSTRKRRCLPVNELALLRTTSSDGLPLPSDAGHVFAIPVAALDPIEDSQIHSTAPPNNNLAGRPMGYRVKKPSSVNGAGAGSPALLLRERFAHLCSSKSKRSQSSTSLRYNTATSSDGFVGAELSIQRNPTKYNKPRGNTRSRMKQSLRTKNELTFISGYLPTPPIEHQHSDLAVDGLRLCSTGFQAMVSATPASEMQPLSQRAVAEFAGITTEQEARECRWSQTRRHDDLVHNQQSSVTAPSRRTIENSSTDSADGADEEVRHSLRFSPDLDKSHEEFIPQWSSTLSGRQTHDCSEPERYFERAMRELDSEEQSDSVNGEFWSQYGGLEQSEGAWDAPRTAGLSHYI